MDNGRLGRLEIASLFSSNRLPDHGIVHRTPHLVLDEARLLVPRRASGKVQPNAAATDVVCSKVARWQNFAVYHSGDIVLQVRMAKRIQSKNLAIAIWQPWSAAVALAEAAEVDVDDDEALCDVIMAEHAALAAAESPLLTLFLQWIFDILFSFCCKVIL